MGRGRKGREEGLTMLSTVEGQRVLEWISSSHILLSRLSPSPLGWMALVVSLSALVITYFTESSLVRYLNIWGFHQR
jgi:hypothetical protein